MLKLLTTLGIFLSLITGCAGSLPRALEKVRVGMDKDRVLEIAYSPQRVFREGMQDHWIYIYFKDDHELHQELTFEDGRVVKVSRPLAKEEWTRELEKAETMEEFEKKAREHQTKAGGGEFKSIDGQPDDPKEK